ncbi:helix-turn-helix domain-containing protein [Rhodococcus jostii]|uniref:helix-turn-helix domain-containing protein n=1 Tax=Rhodococcus jostii TaxID=132919 RepID=UPI00362A702E
MWKDLVDIGLDSSEASFYLAALELGTATIAQISERASVSRTNGYDLTRRLVNRRLLTVTEVGAGDRPSGRSRSEVSVADPAYLLIQHEERRAKLEDLVPRLAALRAKGAIQPRVRYLEGAAGMKKALLDTLHWQGPLKGILSMHDMLELPGERAMAEYIAGRRERRLELRVVRSESKDQAPGWPTSAEDFRVVRIAPARHVFDVSMIIGAHMVAVFSTPAERFAMVIESPAYARMQADLFSVLWDASEEMMGDR